MDSIGVFHKVKHDGKLIELVYHHQKYHPTSFGEEATQDHLFQPIFLCPNERLCEDEDYEYSLDTLRVIASPEYLFSETEAPDHSILPLFWCNNREFDFDNDRCMSCNFSDFGTNYYFCEKCDAKYHKECVKSPVHIRHPYHLDHSLQLHHYLGYQIAKYKECLYCGGIVNDLVYQCTICDVFMHTVCALKTIPFIVDQPKRHDHPLTFFPRQNSLTCNVCGLLRKSNPTYICAECNFVSHSDCMNSPHIIKISRHHHRISYTSSPSSEKWFCGICHQSICGDYGVYTCDKCGDYVAHPRCALRKDVCDRIELESVPEIDITQDVRPFEMIYEGVILHILHDHHLHLEVNILYDENMHCQGCGFPIYEGNIYSCVECDYILHETCAKADRIIQNVLHPHPLTLEHATDHVRKHCISGYKCDACYRDCSYFSYGCHMKGECQFDLDIQCAFVSEPFEYKHHKHPLFLALDANERPICHICREICYKQLCCFKCKFILCMKCAILPEKTRYKHDDHFLKIIFGEDVSEKDWCEVCELNLGDTNTKILYWCKHCFTAIHIECLIGKHLYMSFS